METVQEAFDAIHAGYRRHYVDVAADPDLALLEGDRLYAEGLARLARLGDLHAIEVLAGVITRCAEAHGAGAAGPAQTRSEWEAGALEVNCTPPDL